MNRFFTLASTLLLLSAYTAQAQTSGPRKPPTVTRPSSAEPDNRSADPAPTKTDSPAETRVVNGLSVALKRVKGNSADQTVTLELLLMNPKGNSTVILRTAYAVDPEGDNYSDANGGYSVNEVLYTDVPRKASIRVRGVPAKVKTLALFKFVVWNQLTNQDVDVEYRNLAIDWQ